MKKLNYVLYTSLLISMISTTVFSADDGPSNSGLPELSFPKLKTEREIYTSLSVEEVPNCMKSIDNLAMDFFMKNEDERIFLRKAYEERSENNFENVYEISLKKLYGTRLTMDSVQSIYFKVSDQCRLKIVGRYNF
jgi:hypothetical protein